MVTDTTSACMADSFLLVRAPYSTHQDHAWALWAPVVVNHFPPFRDERLSDTFGSWRLWIAPAEIVAIDVGARTVRSRVTTNDRMVDAVLFAPDGGPLFTAESNREGAFLVARDAITLEPNGTPMRSNSGPIAAMASSADGRWLVTTGIPPTSSRPGGHTVLWNERELVQVGEAFPV